jgi:thioredoxin-related protein
MTKKIFLLVSLATLLCGTIQAQQVEWKTIEQAAKTDTKSNAKLYFVDFYTSWCGWCKKMDRETFSNPVVAKILNTYYIPVKFDAEGSSEFTWKGNKYFGATTAPGSRRGTHSFAKAVLGTQMGFPSFGLFNSNQSKLTIIQGYQSADDFIVALWYFASGDYNRYAFEKYQKIFDKEIRPSMNAKLGL